MKCAILPERRRQSKVSTASAVRRASMPQVPEPAIGECVRCDEATDTAPTLGMADLAVTNCRPASYLAAMGISSPAKARLKRAQVVLVCKKCLKRSRSGKAVRRELKDQLRDRADALSGKKPRIVMTSCFGICPKRAVVVTDGERLARGEVLLMDDRSIKDVALTLTTGS